MAVYDYSWLESCVKELDLPGSPWHELKDLVSKRLAERIRLEGLTYTQLTKVSKFVGKDFIKKHSLYESVRRIDDSHDDLRRLQTDGEVQSFLKDLTVKAAKDANCPMRQDRRVSYAKAFQDFSDLATAIVSSNLEQRGKTRSRKHMHADFGSRLDLGSRVNATDGIIVTMLQVDPQQIETVITRMKGKILPVQLRKYLYRLQLLKAKKTSAGGRRGSPGAFQVGDEITQQKIREQFAKQVKLGLQELKLQQPTKSPLKQVIKSSVVEAFDTSVGLKEFSQNTNLQLETCNVLNILYTHSRKFEYYYVLWVLPLQASIYTDVASKEHQYDLAMWANLLITELLPGWPVINEIAFAVWSQLAAVNKLFGDKLKNHLWTLGIQSSTGDLHAALGSENLPQKFFDGLKVPLQSQFENTKSVHPVLCIRDWIMHLFVGNLQIDVTLYLWDQLFLSNWDIAGFKKACISVFICVSDDVFACQDKSQLFRIFTSHLYTLSLSDVIKVWNRCEM